MGKKDEYRFNLRFDETDEMHRLVVKYLNSCGHNKAKYIVRAFLAYWKMSGKSLLSYVFPEIDAEQLTGYIEQEQEKEMSSEQIDRAFEKTDNIAADEIDSFDGDINDFLQE